jgi:hypothetical protein
MERREERSKSLARQPFAAHHHTSRLPEGRQVLQRISIKQQKVCSCADSDRAELLLFAEERGRVHRRCSNDFVWRQSALMKQVEFTEERAAGDSHRNAHRVGSSEQLNAVAMERAGDRAREFSVFIFHMDGME